MLLLGGNSLVPLEILDALVLLIGVGELVDPGGDLFLFELELDALILDLDLLNNFG
jgi:hypothetical protein